MSGVERRGIFVAPTGTFDAMPKDTLRGDALVELMKKRQEVAQATFESAELPSIEDCGRWIEDGVFYSIAVYWTGEEESVFGSFGIEFIPDTADFVVTWTN